MFVLFQIVVANALSRMLILATASVLSYRWLARLSEQLLAVACGLMLSIALTHLIPEAFSLGGVCPEKLGWAMLVTVVLFLLLERIFTASHSHSHSDDKANDPSSPHGKTCRTQGACLETNAAALMTASGMHNFVDGVLVASTFMVSSVAGWLIALAVMMHEIPQTTGYMVILKNLGFSQKKAFLICLGAASMAVLGGILGWFALSLVDGILPYALVVSAASFIFITFHCLLPEVFAENARRRSVFMQLFLLLAGIALSVLILSGHHHHGHNHEVHAHFETEVSASELSDTIRESVPLMQISEERENRH